MKNLINKTGMTKRELIIIGFLFITFIAGVAVKYSGWKTPNSFSYNESDKEFEQRIKSAFAELDENNNSKGLTPQQQTTADEMKKLADSLITSKETEPKDKKQTKPLKKININTALAGDLQLLPGVGEVMAERIIEYREQKGGFRKPEDIKNIKGIGDKKFEQMKEYIIVE